MAPFWGEAIMVHDLVVGVLIWSRAATLSVLGLGEMMDSVSWQAPCRGFAEVESACDVRSWSS